jgi:hypothetical protein
MPRATTNPNETEKIWLKSCPEGYVELRRMSYGEVLRKRQMGTTMSLQQGSDGDTQGVMEMVQRRMTEFEFAKCVVDHNLEDENGKTLDFKKSNTFDRLDPRIGEEIGEEIDKMNQLEKVVDSGNSVIELGEAS